MLMLIISIHLIFNGFMKPKALLTETSQLVESKHAGKGRKVIFMLFDALREDFVEWPEDQTLNIEEDSNYAYKGTKVSLFRELTEKQPNNALLFPLRSEMPTVTVARIQSFLSGVISTVFEFTESLTTRKFTEDHILKQLRNKLGDKTRAIFYGEDIWLPRFGDWFTKQAAWPANFRDLDNLDGNVR